MGSTNETGDQWSRHHDSPLRERIAIVRTQGWVLADEDLVDHVISIGAPVFGAKGKLVGSVSVSGLKARYPADRRKAVIQQVVTAANAMSARLGFVQDGIAAAS